MQIRYLRDWLNGSSVDSQNIWVEIRVLDGSHNVALNSTVTSNFNIDNPEFIVNGQTPGSSSTFSTESTKKTTFSQEPKMGLMGGEYSDFSHWSYSDFNDYDDSFGDYSDWLYDDWVFTNWHFDEFSDWTWDNFSHYEDFSFDDFSNWDNAGQEDYAVGEAGENQYVQIDLGAIYDVDIVRVWHYYEDERTFYGTKIEVSEDGDNWDIIFDSELAGAYKETDYGLLLELTPMIKKGSIIDSSEFNSIINYVKQYGEDPSGGACTSGFSLNTEDVLFEETENEETINSLIQDINNMFTEGEYINRVIISDPGEIPLYIEGRAKAGDVNTITSRLSIIKNVNCFVCINITRAYCSQCDGSCYNCFSCVGCESCDRCVNCQNCHGSCQSCDGCHNCESCEECVSCESCDSTCQYCVNCQFCDGCQHPCYVCVTCISCFSACNNCDRCHSCENCHSCDNCDSCQNCDLCDSCYSCAWCVNCQNCVSCDDRN